MKYIKNLLLWYILLAGSFLLASCGDDNIVTKGNPIENPDPAPDPEAGLRVVNKVKYRPYNYMMWDNWYIVKEDSIHLFHLQGIVNGVSYPRDTNLRGFGHAASGDLLHWNEKPEVLSLYDKNLDNEADFRYTGCTVEHQGKYYTFYTMRKWAGQRIGVAVSDDLYTWTEYEGNPVIVPDGRWFITFSGSSSAGSSYANWDRVDCRDMVVVKGKSGGGFYGYFVSSSDMSGLTSPTAVIGLAYSTDLLHWEQRGIVYYPTGVSMPEMIDVFEHEGVWYMTLTTAKDNGSLTAFSDPYITRGTIYATAASPQGPFVEDMKDNVLIGGQLSSGYSMRTVYYQGERRLMYVDVDNGVSVLSLPKNIGLNNQGQLRALYASDLLPKLRIQEISPVIYDQPANSFGWPTYGGLWKEKEGVFSCKTDKDSWQAAVFEGASANMEISFTVEDFQCSSFGIVLARPAAEIFLSDLSHILVIEPKKDRVYLTNHTWDFQNCRSYTFEEGRKYDFRVLLMGNTIEFYINDELVFNSSLYSSGNYLPGIFANDGTLDVLNLKLFRLEE